MKILFLTHHLRGNDGWSRYAKDFACGLQKRGEDVLSLVSELDPRSDLESKGAQSTGLSERLVLGDHISYIANPIQSFVTAQRVKKIIQEYNPDVIHFIVETYATILPFLLASVLKNRKVVLTVHSTYAFMPILVSGWRRRVSTFLTRNMFQKIDMTICVSKYTEKHFLQHMAGIGESKLVENKTCILAGGVEISEAHKQVSKKIEKPADAPKEILFVGAIKSRKGLLEAVAALAFVRTDFLYRVVGTYDEKNPYVKLVKQKIAESGLQKKVVFEGRISDEKLVELYRNADLYLMLSTNNGADFEGYGLVYIEANAFGVPCIGPGDSGVTDAIVDGKTGFLVNQFDSKAVAEKIDLVLSGRVINSQDCVEWALENQTDKKVDALFDIYKKPAKK
jgi:glycosyltransferase involved in cell wall biosynthesis